MSLHGASAAGLPAVDRALEPAWVRHGSPTTQKAYAAALAFEATLVEELSKSLAATSDLGGESAPEGESSSEEGGSADAGAGGVLSSMLPPALSSSVMRTGGLGLAAQLTRDLGGVDATARRSGGTAPRATTGAEAGTGVGTGAPASASAAITGGTSS